MSDLRGRLMEALARPAGPSSDFDLNAVPGARPKVDLRPAGVLIGIEGFGDTPQVILTKRSSALRHHPGQVAFPGGKVDPGDADATAAALREAREEVALPSDAVEVLGTLPPHETVTGFSITPVLAMITRPFRDVPEAGEVDEVFRAPLSHVTDPARFVIEGRMWRGAVRRYYAVPYGPYYIWGATARILRGLAERMA